MTVCDMINNHNRRVREGWTFQWGIDRSSPEVPLAGEYIKSIPVKHTHHTFDSDEAALEYVKAQAVAGSIYHQRAIEYVTAIALNPKYNPW